MLADRSRAEFDSRSEEQGLYGRAAHFRVYHVHGSKCTVEINLGHASTGRFEVNLFAARACVLGTHESAYNLTGASQGHDKLRATTRYQIRAVQGALCHNGANTIELGQ